MARIVQIYKNGAEPPLPPVGRQALTLGKAVLRLGAQVMTGGAILVPEDVMAARAACCRACEHFRHSDARCSLCGCCTGRLLLDKLRYASEACPASPPKWGRWEKGGSTGS